MVSADPAEEKLVGAALGGAGGCEDADGGGGGARDDVADVPDVCGDMLEN